MYTLAGIHQHLVTIFYLSIATCIYIQTAIPFQAGQALGKFQATAFPYISWEKTTALS